MPIVIRIRTDKTLAQIHANLTQLPRWMPAIVRTHIKPLGQAVKREMRSAIRQHRYKGTLEDSIVDRYEAGGFRAIIGPTAMRGRWDAGLLLEHGTRPIPNAPWQPIKAWADFRGLPGFPVWYKIRTRGVAAHPFLDRTLRASEVRIGEAARRMGLDAATAIVRGAGTESVG